jgi:hypothetical protein
MKAADWIAPILIMLIANGCNDMEYQRKIHEIEQRVIQIEEGRE